MPGRHRLRKLLLTIALLAALGLAAQHFGDPERYRSWIEQIASDGIGKPVRLQGPLAWSLRHGPGLDARQVEVLNPDWASGKAFASADRVRLALSWSDLLRGHFAIGRLDLNGLRVALESNDQRNNWQFSPRSQGGAAQLQAATTVTGLSISYRNDTDSNEVHLPALMLTGGAADAPLQLSTTLPTPLTTATLVLQGPTLSALLADPLRWTLTGGVQDGADGLSGRLDIDLSGPRPSLGGQLSLLIAEARDGGISSSAANPAAPIPTLLKALRAVDANIDINARTPVWRGHVGLTLDHGRLELQTSDGPQQAQLKLQIDATGPLPTLQTSIEAGPIDLAALASMTGLDLGGPLSAASLSLDAHSSGHGMQELLAALRGTLIVTELSNLPRLKNLKADRIELQQTDQGLILNTIGSWAGENSTMTLTGASLQQLLDKDADYPFEEDIRLGDSRFHFKGYFQRQADERGQPGPRGRLSLSGNDPSQLNLLLSSLTSVSLPQGLKYRISGDLENHPDSLELKRISAEIDGIAVKGALRYAIGTNNATPLLSGKLSIPELKQPKHGKRASSSKQSWYDNPLPALPSDLRVDVDLAIDRLAVLTPSARKLRTTIALKNGKLTLAPLRLEIGGQRLSGRASYQHEKDLASIELSLKTPAFEWEVADSNLLEGNGLRLDGSRGHLKLSATGSSAAQWLDQLRVDGRLKTFTVAINSPKHQRLSVIELRKPRLSRSPGKPWLLRASGDQDGRKLRLSGRLSSASGKAPPRFKLDLSMADMQFSVDGELHSGSDQRLARLDFELSANTPESLPVILHSSITNSGPYLLKGKVRGDGDKYQVRELQFLAGPNDLSGSIDLDLGRQPNKLSLTINSGHLAPLLRSPPTTATAQSASSDGAVAPMRIIPDTHLVSRIPRDWDADYNISIDELALGVNRLSKFHLRAKLRKHRLLVDPVRSTLNGKGSLSARVDARLVDGQLQAHVSAQIQRLNLGRLLTRDDLDRVVPWYTGIDLTLDGKGNYLRSFLADANGGIRFIGGHMDLDTSVMDLWTLDLIGIAMPGLLKKKDKDLGLLCSVAGYRIDDGIMTSEGMLFNTAQAVIRGSGTISLHDESLKLLLSPKKKRLSLFSIATPVALTGTLSNPQAHVPPEQFAITAGGLALKVFQPWVLAGGLLASGYRIDKPCLSTLQDMSSKTVGDKPASSDSPIDDVLHELGSGAQRVIE